MAQQDAHRPARRPADGKQVSAARILAAAFGTGAGLLGLEHGFFETRQGSATSGGLVIHAIGSPCQPHSALTPAVTAATPFVLVLILLSALAHDSQQSQAAQQPEGPPPNGRDELMEVRHGQD